MIPRQLLGEIESHRFAARLNVASDVGTFVRTLELDESANGLLEVVVDEGERVELWQRIVGLSRLAIDGRYRHPFDVALAVYLWVLDQRDRGLSRLATELVEEARNTVWARRLVAAITRWRDLESEASTARDDMLTVRTASVSGDQRDHNVGNTLISAGMVSQWVRRSEIEAVPVTSVSVENLRALNAITEIPQVTGRGVRWSTENLDATMAAA